MNLDIRPATPERVPAVAAMVARAFADDPMIRWSLGPDDLPNRMRRYFTLINEQWADLGVLWESGDAAGAAAWIPPDQQNGLADQNAQLRDAFHALTSDGGVRHDALWNWVESKIPDEPLWFLDLVAVEPERQRGGIGRALISSGWLALRPTTSRPSSRPGSSATSRTTNGSGSESWMTTTRRSTGRTCGSCDPTLIGIVRR